MTTPWFIGSARVGLFLGAAVMAAGLTARGDERKAGAAGQAAPAASESSASPERIDRLVRQLGDNDYFVREHAQEELAQLGVDAFDALNAATEDEDPEIAARAKYLLQMPVEWTAKNDPPYVKALLTDYGKQDVANREVVARKLAVLPDGEGVDAVCRLVRFEKSVLISKIAATALLPRGQAATTAQPATLDAIRKRLGGCRRPAAVWLDVLARFGSDPASALAEWSRLADAEYELWRQSPGKTSAEIAGSLLRFEVAWLDKLGRRGQSAQAMERLLALEDNGDAESLAELAQWLVDRKLWSGLDELSRRASPRFEHDPHLLYLAAEAYAAQGRSKQAEAKALSAFHMAVPPDQEEDNPIQTAAWLQQRGRIAWARREYAGAIAAGNRAAASVEQQTDGARAGIYLAEMLHDQGEDLEAAETLKRIIERLHSPAGGPLKSQLHEAGHEQEQIRALMHYFFACHWESRHDVAQQRGSLEKAASADPNDVDVLIARYRLPDEPRGDHAKVVEAIERTARAIHERFATSPVPSNYNEYAWLIGNTEGDFEEAVRCSFKSIELHPEEGMYYDTLAHVYFGKGDWEKAVKYQAIAAELDPYSGLIQKALAEFRKKLEQSKKAHR